VRKIRIGRDLVRHELGLDDDGDLFALGRRL